MAGVPNLPEEYLECSMCTNESTTSGSVSDSIKHFVSDQPAKSVGINSVQRAKKCGKQYPCTMCDKTFDQPTNLKTHERIHTGDKPFECNVCSKKFINSSNLKTHERVHTKEKPCECVICFKSFVNTSNLKSHQQTHVSHNNCTEFQKSFNTDSKSQQISLSNVKMHNYQSPLDGKSHSCEFCPKTFCNTSNLKVHEQTHTKEKFHICDVCYKTFCNSSNLKTHQRTHTNEKTYQCNYCEKMFINSSNMKTHERVHTNDKSYKCSFCPKTFINSSNLKTHERFHLNDKSYICIYCSKGFINSSNLKTHLKTHTGNKDYQCNVCHKEFINSSNLKLHESNKHSHSGNSSQNKTSPVSPSTSTDSGHVESKSLQEIDSTKNLPVTSSTEPTDTKYFPPSVPQTSEIKTSVSSVISHSNPSDRHEQSHPQISNQIIPFQNNPPFNFSHVLYLPENMPANSRHYFDVPNLKLFQNIHDTFKRE